MSEHVLTGLTAAQADGLACVWCGADYLSVRVPHVPVGRSESGSQVFACTGDCAGILHAFAVFERAALVTGWPDFRQALGNLGGAR